MTLLDSYVDQLFGPMTRQPTTSAGSFSHLLEHHAIKTLR
jgi:hypothetical protein